MPSPCRTIAHVLPWPTVGGTELATLRIAGAVRAGFRSLAFVTPGAAAVRETFEAAGVEVVEYRPVEPSYRHAGPFLRSSWRLARDFRRHGVDLVHCADLLAGFHAALGGRLAGLPVVCHVRCNYESLSARDRSFLLPVSRFVFVSRETWRRFALRVSPRRGRVLYDGIELPGRTADAEGVGEVRRELGIPPGSRVVGMVARVAPAKDFPTLIRAAARVVAECPDTRFVVVGDHDGTPAYRAHFRAVHEALRASGLERHFLFTGFRADVPRLIDAFDVAVLSTHTEGLPLVLLEAMARGKPVIATAVGGIPEVVRHAETGLLHAHADAEELADGLLLLLGDPVRAAALGAAGRRSVRDRFAQDRFARDLENLYRDLPAAPAPPGSVPGAGPGPAHLSAPTSP